MHPFIYWNNSPGIAEYFPTTEIIKMLNFSSMCVVVHVKHALCAQDSWSVTQEVRLNPFNTPFQF